MTHPQTDTAMRTETPRRQGDAPLISGEQARPCTVEAVLAAAKAQFEAAGYDRTTIRSIASKAGFSTGAVFAHFASKADLYRAIFGHPPVTPEEGRALRLEVEALRQALDDARRTDVVCR